MTTFQIVAFDGKLLAPIARALPIVRHTPPYRYYIPSPDSPILEPTATWSADDFASWQEEGRMTRLPKPVTAFQGAMVVYVKGEAVVALDALPREIRDTPVTWQRLDTPTEVWATCLTDSLVLQMMNDWGELLLHKTSLALMQFYRQRSQVQSQHALRLAKMAISAARRSSLRESIFLRYGLAVRHTMRPESLSNVHRLIKREMPSLTWNSFLEEMQRIEDELTSRASRHVDAKPLKQLSHPRHDDFFEQSKLIANVRDFDEQLTAAGAFAASVVLDPASRDHSLSVLRTELQKRDRSHPRLVLSSSLFLLLKTEPLCYLPDVIMPLTQRCALDFRQLADALEQLEQHGLTTDTLTEIGRELANR